MKQREELTEGVKIILCTILVIAWVYFVLFDKFNLYITKII